MDAKTINKNLQTVSLHHHPGHIIVGSEQEVVNFTLQFLQAMFCKQGGCATCIPCKQIQNLEHHAILWLAPEKYYTLETLDRFADVIAFRLEEDKKFFFIFQKADTLGTSCSNKLLKTLEEPPQGYHFIFLTNRLASILPTIQSRCIVTTVSSLSTKDSHPIIPYLTHPSPLQMIAFLHELDMTPIGEQETIDLVDHLLQHWIATNHSSITENRSVSEYSHTILTVLQDALEYPPMPGSSKLFWKNLYLQMLKANW